jgi:hypothetical protein
MLVAAGILDAAQSPPEGKKKGGWDHQAFQMLLRAGGLLSAFTEGAEELFFPGLR